MAEHRTSVPAQSRVERPLMRRIEEPVEQAAVSLTACLSEHVAR
ncbi:hypothetical protein [Streptomyces sp. NPDC018693]